MVLFSPRELCIVLSLVEGSRLRPRLSSRWTVRLQNATSHFVPQGVDWYRRLGSQGALSVVLSYLTTSQ
jgi:hypothetical protein